MKADVSRDEMFDEFYAQYRINAGAARVKSEGWAYVYIYLHEPLFTMQ